MNIKGMEVELVDYFVQSHKTGSLPSSLSPMDIMNVLGEPNVDDDVDKVEYSWTFTIDDEDCAIWDYRGSRWSTFGPSYKIRQLFNL